MIAEAPIEKAKPGGTSGAAPMGWPAILLAIMLAALYAPVVVDIQPLWHNERGGHCIFIVPLAIGLAYLRRDLLKACPKAHDSRGLWLIGLGLLMECISFILRLDYLEAYSLPIVVAGYVLLQFGPTALRILRYPILMLLFVVSLPNFLISPISQWISRISADGSVGFVQILGYPITQQGNILQIPGLTVVVADVCSGFNKLSILFIMSLVYGDMFTISMPRRGLLSIASLPIAVLANILRIAIILLVSIYSGATGLHRIHDWAEVIVVAIAFFLFVGVGAFVGCKKPRFSV
jgi:exosortase